MPGPGTYRIDQDVEAQETAADKLALLVKLARLGIVELDKVHIEATTFDGGKFKLTSTKEDT